MTILLTGVAGFVGMHVAKRLLANGFKVFGIDNITSYYDVALKKGRLQELEPYADFEFQKVDIADEESLKTALSGREIHYVVHLAAQAGVRYSLENPHSYAHSNLTGFLNILEFCRHNSNLQHFIYASSSSVYGGNKELPYSTDQSVDRPVSLYAATKKSNELMAHSYSHLYRIPSTGLRFFTVYGPWGRPDMAYWLFTEAMLAGKTIKIFNNGDMKRDFTYIDDVVDGVVKLLPVAPQDKGMEQPPYRVVNIGNNKPEALMELVSTLEKTLDVKANLEFLPMQKGDVKETFANIDPMRELVGYEPQTSLAQGIPLFVDWYREFIERE
ncbi:NAD-dependent epimerase/dehydratase family protein [Sneathiella glossodoripedis]|uniref:NAD-dependent epimerase/dehydratase family protein n=1 Tax=Sneathiella glossodoripedis TaxID=418853 RepID=UPI00046F924F|nr:NAD-dependent epimerase/dehydratase family protein [Sneathiella glossodoripedis]